MYRAVAAAALRIIGIPVVHTAELELLVQGLSEDGLLLLGYGGRPLVSVFFFLCVSLLRGRPVGICLSCVCVCALVVFLLVFVFCVCV